MAYVIVTGGGVQGRYYITDTCNKPRACVKINDSTSYMPLRTYVTTTNQLMTTTTNKGGSQQSTDHLEYREYNNVHKVVATNGTSTKTNYNVCLLCYSTKSSTLTNITTSRRMTTNGIEFVGRLGYEILTYTAYPMYDIVNNPKLTSTEINGIPHVILPQVTYDSSTIVDSAYVALNGIDGNFIYTSLSLRDIYHSIIDTKKSTLTTVFRLYGQSVTSYYYSDVTRVCVSATASVIKSPKGEYNYDAFHPEYRLYEYIDINVGVQANTGTTTTALVTTINILTWG